MLEVTMEKPQRYKQEITTLFRQLGDARMAVPTQLRHPHARAPRSLQVYMSALSQLVMATVSQLSRQAALAELQLGAAAARAETAAARCRRARAPAPAVRTHRGG
jgi:hypothetical protein